MTMPPNAPREESADLQFLRKRYTPGAGEDVAVPPRPVSAPPTRDASESALTGVQRRAAPPPTSERGGHTPLEWTDSGHSAPLRPATSTPPLATDAYDDYEEDFEFDEGDSYPEIDHRSDVVNDSVGYDDYRVRSKRDAPTQGVRKFLFDTLHLPVSKSRKEQEQDRLVAMMRKSLLSPKIIGVIGGKGGVGKTSSVMTIASMMAKYRSGNIAAVTLDYNSTLALRTRKVSDAARSDMSLLEFATDRSLSSSSQIIKCFQVNRQGLYVLGTGLNPISHDVLNAAQYRRAMNMLRKVFDIVFVDYGNIPNNDVFWESLNSLDALVLVTSTENDSLQGIRLAESTVREAGRADLLADHTTMFVNYRSPAAPKVDLDNFVGKMQAVGNREVLEVPWDDHLSEGGPVDIDLLSKPVKYQLLRGAAIVAASLPS